MISGSLRKYRPNASTTSKKQKLQAWEINTAASPTTDEFTHSIYSQNEQPYGSVRGLKRYQLYSRRKFLEPRIVEPNKRCMTILLLFVKAHWIRSL
jgi:hypothetical protein